MEGNTCSQKDCFFCILESAPHSFLHPNTHSSPSLQCGFLKERSRWAFPEKSPRAFSTSLLLSPCPQESLHCGCHGNCAGATCCFLKAKDVPFGRCWGGLSCFVPCSPETKELLLAHRSWTLRHSSICPSSCGSLLLPEFLNHELHMPLQSNTALTGSVPVGLCRVLPNGHATLALG